MSMPLIQENSEGNEYFENHAVGFWTSQGYMQDLNQSKKLIHRVSEHAWGKQLTLVHQSRFIIHLDYYSLLF